MTNPKRNRPSGSLILKSTLLCITLYSMLLLSSIFFKTNLTANIQSMLKTTIGRAATSIFCSQSSSLTYSLSNNEETLTSSFVYNTLYSPAMQYVQIAQLNADNNSFEDCPVITDTAAKENSEDSTSSDLAPDASQDQKVQEDTSLETYDDVFFEDEYDAESAFAAHDLSESEADALASNKKLINKLTTSMDRNYLLESFYKVDKYSGIDSSIWNVNKLLTSDLTIKKDSSKPQILIFHTHAHEAFSDSSSGVRADSIVGVGDELTKILTEQYGYNVIHYAKQYNFNTAYNEALDDLETILSKNPSIQVVIDMHRDGVSDSCKTHTVCTVNNSTMAQVMFFNGVSYNKKGAITRLPNKNLQTNLAFGLQMKLYAMQTFPELTKKNFIKNYRYNMHMMGRYSLVEVGDNNNTVAEAKAAMAPLAATIDHVLSTPNEY